MVLIRLRLRAAVLLLAALVLVGLRAEAAEQFRVATFNVENYLETSNGARPAKSSEAKAAVRESIHALSPDVIALEEIGGTNALLELQASLKAEGMDLPNWELVWGSDTNIQTAILSRLPIEARHPWTNDFFLLNGKRWRVSRGFAEVDIRVNDHYAFTLLAAHLKSKVPISKADEADLRLAEAKLFREKIDARLAANPDLNLIVLGDFNDAPDSEPIKMILGRGSRGLVDTRPAEQRGEGGSETGNQNASGAVTWTQAYAKEDVYSRMDYILLSRGMAREWNPTGTYVLASPGWGTASDHRPLVATFVGEDR